MNSILILGQDVNNIKFTNVDGSDGLPSNYINDIISDQLGFIWIATNDGLCRYDGAEKFKIFRGNDTSIKNGLRSSNIYTIHEDKNQNLWVGTRLGGLSCLHQPTGTWTTYLHDKNDPTSISNNEVLCILEDQYGRLWFGTEDGLNLFDPIKKNFTSFKVDQTNPNSLQGKAIISIMEDNKGWIWIGTWAGGLSLLQPSENGDISKSTFKQFKTTENTEPNHVWKIYQDKQKRYWIGSHHKGLVLMQLPENASNKASDSCWNPYFHFYYQYNENTDHPNSISYNQVKDIYQDNNGKLWIASIDGLNYIEPSNLPAPSIYNQITIDKPTLIFNKKYYDLGDEYSLKHNEVNAIYEDKQGIMWFGTFGGISKFNWYNSQFNVFDFTLKNGRSPNINEMYICPNKTAWFGTINKGLYQYNVEKNDFREVLNRQGQPLIDDYVTALYCVDHSQLYLGKSAGISILNMNTSTLTNYPISEEIRLAHPSFYIKKIFVDSKNNVWLGTESGLIHFDPSTNIYTPFLNDPNIKNTISDNSITDIVEDNNGYLWVSTFNGLNRLKYFSTSNVSIKRFQSNINYPNSLPFNRLTCLSYLDNKLYIGTTSGVYAYDTQKNIFESYNDNTHKRYIQSIEHALDGNIWASTTEGILYIDTKNQSINIFKESDGIGDLSFRNGVSSIDRDGYIYFGNKNGFTRLHPKLAIKNATPPPVYFTDIKTVSPSGERLKEGIYIPKISIEHDVYALSIEFASLNYHKPEKNQYAYQLEGFDADWIYTKKLNPVVYTNLNPGNYTFKIKAANNDGIWNEEGNELNITVRAAIWETLYFKIAMVFLLAGIVWLSVRYYTNGIKHHNRVLKQYNENLNHEIKERKRVERALHQREQYMEFLVQQRTAELEIKNNEVKNLLEKIKGRNEELEHIVAKRTEKLQEFNQDLQRSNKDLEQFAYIASHDLQEPLRIISSFLGLLSRQYKSDLDHAAIEYINFALDASDRMSGLIKSLLTYSRVGRHELIIENIDLNRVLEEKLLDLSQFIKERNANIVIHPLPTVECERNQIAMVFYNLINNAIKFNKSTQPMVEVSAEYMEDHQYWQFSVKDNGIGIDSKFQHKIFEVFRRLHTRQDYEGTGIGLAVCQKIINRHGGSIWINSIPNQGTTFTFDIKAKKQDTITENLHQHTNNQRRYASS